MSKQRHFHKIGKLAQDCAKQLEGIGFIWGTQNKQREERFNELVVYQDNNDNCNVPQSQCKMIHQVYRRNGHRHK